MATLIASLSPDQIFESQQNAICVRYKVIFDVGSCKKGKKKNYHRNLSIS